MEDKKEMKKYYAGTLWRLVVAGLTINVIELIVGQILSIVLTVNPDFPYLMPIQYILIVVADAAGIGVFILLNRKREKSVPKEGKLGFGWWIVILFVCFGVMFVGNIIGLIVSGLILFPFGYNLSNINAATNLLTGDLSWLSVILGAISAGIIAPILEELLFRKLFIDYFGKYGKGAAILMSGLLFGLFHGNFSQFFYAFAMGIILAYVYSYTGKIKYTIAVHMTINFIASGIMMFFLKIADMNMGISILEVVEKYGQGLIDMDAYVEQFTELVSANPIGFIGLMAYGLFIMFYYLLMFTGIIMCRVFLYKFIKFRKGQDMGAKGSKLAAMFNWASYVFYAMALFLFLYYYLNMILPVIMKFLK